MCEWIAEKMPWLVEHVGGMSLAGQIVLAFAVLAAIVLGYYGVQAGVQSAVYNDRPRRRPARGNWLMRWLAIFSDDEPYADWMDAEAWRE